MCTEAIIRKEDVVAVGNWLMEHTATKYYLAYFWGVRSGLRLSELKPLVEERCGQNFDMDSYRKILKRAVKECGIRCNVGMHTPRKTFAFHHFLKYNNLELLQMVLGHSDSEITAQYIGL